MKRLQNDFDAQSYVKSSLDAEYHREYADYANLMEISEEDVKKQMEEEFNESIRQQGKDCTGNERSGLPGNLALFYEENI